MSSSNKVHIGEIGCTWGKQLFEHNADSRNYNIDKSDMVNHCLSGPNSSKPNFVKTQIGGKERNIYKQLEKH